MRMPGALLAGLAAAAAAVLAAPASAGPPGASYPWAQPGAVELGPVVSVQPPASVPIAPLPVRTVLPLPPAATFPWGQPGSTAASTVSVQPAAGIVP